MIDVRSIVRPGGLLADWLTFTEPFEFPDAYSLFSLLAVASAAIDGRIIVNPDTEPCVKTNLYVLLYGPPGGRKGPPMRLAYEALQDAVPETPRLPRSFSMERLTSLLAEESGERGRCGGLIFTEEFHRLIGGRDYQLDNLAFLSELWDCPPDYPRSTQSHGDELLLFPYITILAASNPDWIESIDPRILSGGALRRLLVVNEYGPKRDDVTSPRKDAARLQRVVGWMAERLGLAAFRREARMLLSRPASMAMDEWYRGPVRARRRMADTRMAYFASCLQAHALKIAAVVHLLEGGPAHLLSDQAFDEGRRLVEALWPGTADLYLSLVATPYAKLRSALRRTVAAAGAAGLSALDIDRKMAAAYGMRPRDVAEARVALVREGVLQQSTDGNYILIGD